MYAVCAATLIHRAHFYAERRGLWHEMATALSRLYAMGVASELINDICSLSPKEQNLWVVASSVYYSLLASPLCSQVVGKYVSLPPCDRFSPPRSLGGGREAWAWL
jgi:hypothetical protein